MEGWLLGTDISCSLCSSCFPPLLFRNAFLQNGTMQWGVLPHASCCNLHLDFSLLNQHVPPIFLEAFGAQLQRPLNSSLHQDSEQLRPLHFQFFSLFTVSWPSEWAGRGDARGKGQEAALISGCDYSAGQGEQAGEGQGCSAQVHLGRVM